METDGRKGAREVSHIIHCHSGTAAAARHNTPLRRAAAPTLASFTTACGAVHCRSLSFFILKCKNLSTIRSEIFKELSTTTNK